MRKMMMIAVMAIVAMTASAQNTLRDKGTFTLQPKVGLGLGSFSGSWTTTDGESHKIRVGLVAGVEGEYYINDWFSAAIGVSYAQQGWKNTFNSSTKVTGRETIKPASHISASRSTSVPSNSIKRSL